MKTSDLELGKDLIKLINCNDKDMSRPITV